ncbi:hypothetical protein BDW67DRAFT_94726 [Aspergillus spinulosporus]
MISHWTKARKSPVTVSYVRLIRPAQKNDLPANIHHKSAWIQVNSQHKDEKRATAAPKQLRACSDGSPMSFRSVVMMKSSHHGSLQCYDLAITASHSRSDRALKQALGKSQDRLCIF